MNALNTWLKEKFMVTAFDPLGEMSTLDSIPQISPISKEQVEELKLRVDMYLQKNLSKAIQQEIVPNVSSYFNEVLRGLTITMR